ncbi:alpha/beta hydrolase [Aerococcaceae bacterium DSM 111176]|nr:alpha/beta hydrolase [Aerococcaceae bacterium DSM 111176]
MLIQINEETQLYYQISGQGPILLFIHGNGEDHTIFNELVCCLQDNFTCIQLDTRGHGQSSGPIPDSYESLADDVDSFIQALDINELSIIGFSDGAIIGTLLATRQAPYLNKLVAIGLNLSPDTVRAKYQDEINQLIQENPNNQVFKLMINGPCISLDEISSIQIPTLLVAGEDDVLTTKQYEEIADALPDGHVYIESGADHTSYVINQTNLETIIHNFMK